MASPTLQAVKGSALVFCPTSTEPSKWSWLVGMSVRTMDVWLNVSAVPEYNVAEHLVISLSSRSSKLYFYKVQLKMMISLKMKCGKLLYVLFVNTLQNNI